MSDPRAVDVLATPEGRPPLSRRTRLGAAVVVVLLAATGWVVDRDLRADERVAVGGCAAVTDEAVERAAGLIGYMVAYVRPTLASMPDGRVREEIFDLVSRSARSALPTVEQAIAVCDRVEVLPLHGANVERLDACRDLLAMTRDHLERVRDEGRSAFVDSATRNDLRRVCAGA